MTFFKSFTVALALGCALAAHAADDVVAVKSTHSAADTATRLVAAIQERELKIFTRIDHAAGAATVGNPQGDTPLMTCEQTVGIDLPLKALVWQDDKGQIWLGSNDPAWIAAPHGVSNCAIVPNLAKTLAGLVAAAAPVP